ncbi:MAG TPA: hypothetical protein VFE86_07525, partial [Ilumatobacteraceae bacterium]|nr:hypothetical protein [Ilumatobacteraceae bacterium]
MNFTVTLGAAAVIGAIGMLWWGVSARPSAARANLFAGLPQADPRATKSTSTVRRLGQAARRALPKSFVDRLELNLVQAGHPQGLDLARILGIKVILAATSAFMLVLVGKPIVGLVAGGLLFFLPDYWVLTMRDRRQSAMQADAADTIDQLTICVEAGLGFDSALARVATTTDGPLTEELRHT